MDNWYRTPRGVMRHIGPSLTPGCSDFRDREQRQATFHDADCKPTKAPTWFRRQSQGYELLRGKRA